MEQRCRLNSRAGHGENEKTWDYEIGFPPSRLLSSASTRPFLLQNRHPPSAVAAVEVLCSSFPIHGHSLEEILGDIINPCIYKKVAVPITMIVSPETVDC